MKPPPANGLDRTSARRGASAAHNACAILGIAGSLLTSASEALPPWASDTHPTDRAKSHGEEVVASPHAYRVIQGGTMDGRNCRTPMGCGLAREGAYLQTWESNRSVRMENVGEGDLVNPWLSNGRNTFRSVAEIVATAVTPGMTDAEKAFALWFQEIQHRHHSPGDNNELLDPIKVFNVYGYNTCGNDSICLATLWRAAGLKAAPARALGHCVSQVFHEREWLDARVWQVLPKIQARLLKSMLETPAGLDGLRECLTTRLALEGVESEVAQHDAGFEVSITRCPWHDLMVKSERAHLSAQAGRRTCGTEYPVWAAEFSSLRFERREKVCEGRERCGLSFTVAVEANSSR